VKKKALMKGAKRSWSRRRRSYTEVADLLVEKSWSQNLYQLCVMGETTSPNNANLDILTRSREERRSRAFCATMLLKMERTAEVIALVTIGANFYEFSMDKIFLF